jgi:hypothetical protein
LAHEYRLDDAVLEIAGPPGLGLAVDCQEAGWLSASGLQLSVMMS